jgi:hypothetical protein
VLLGLLGSLLHTLLLLPQVLLLMMSPPAAVRPSLLQLLN